LFYLIYLSDCGVICLSKAWAKQKWNNRFRFCFDLFYNDYFISPFFFLLLLLLTRFVWVFLFFLLPPLSSPLLSNYGATGGMSKKKLYLLFVSRCLFLSLSISLSLSFSALCSILLHRVFDKPKQNNWRKKKHSQVQCFFLIISLKIFWFFFFSLRFFLVFTYWTQSSLNFVVSFLVFVCVFFWSVVSVDLFLICFALYLFRVSLMLLSTQKEKTICFVIYLFFPTLRLWLYL